MVVMGINDYLQSFVNWTELLKTIDNTQTIQKPELKTFAIIVARWNT